MTIAESVIQCDICPAAEMPAYGRRLIVRRDGLVVAAPTMAEGRMPTTFTGLALISTLLLMGCSAESPEAAPPKPAPAEAPRTLTPGGPPDAGAVAIEFEPGASPAAPNATPEAPLAPNVAIEEIALYQGTRVTLGRAGQHNAARPMPVVAGRDALLRVFVGPQGGVPGRSLEAQVYVTSKQGQGLSAHKATLKLTRRSAEADATSTFNMLIPGSSITVDSEFTIRIVESGAPAVTTNANHPAQYPPNGARDRFDAKVTGALRVVVVPVIYGADGSNRMPDVSAAVMETARKRMLEFYPVPNVDIRLRTPVQWNQPILPNGTGWDEVLDAVTQLRLTDNAPFDVYYYGAFAPSPTLQAYCASNCLLGLSNFADNVGDAAFRTSAGAFYNDMEAIDTLPHEIGHAHGRHHANCGGTTDNDPAYPYQGAKTGVWGYSVVTRQLQPPTLYDQMSYCTPSWQSDYTYRGLFDRAHALASLNVSTAPPTGANGSEGANGAEGAGRSYRMLKIAPDGAMRWAGKPFQTRTIVQGTPQRVTFMNREGRVMSEAIAHGSSYDHLGGGVLIVPYEERPGFDHVRVDVRGNVHRVTR